MRDLTIETDPGVVLDEKIAAIIKILEVNQQIFKAIKESTLYPSLVQGVPKLTAIQSLIEEAIADLNGPIVAQALSEYESAFYASSSR